MPRSSLLASASHASCRMRACICLLLAVMASLVAGDRTINLPLLASYGDSTSAIMEAAGVVYTMTDSTLTLTGSSDTIPDLVEKLWGTPATVDFAVMAQLPSTANDKTTTDLISYNDDITSFPIAGTAAVPIYNLPDRTVPLILTRQNLVDIMLGNLTQWDDARLATLNADLPSETITVIVSQSKSAQTLAFTTAMVSFDSTWATIVGEAADVVSWPLSAYESYEIVNASQAMVSYVQSTPYSFSFSSMANAMRVDAMRASMINQAGQLVIASTDSITLSMLDAGSKAPTATTFDWVTEMADGTGYGSWPMAYMIAVYLPKTSTRTTCTSRASLVTFWEWFFAAKAVSNRAELLGIAILPAIMYTTLGIDDLLRKTIMCNGEAASTSATSQITIYGAKIGAFAAPLIGQLLEYYGSTDADYAYQYEAVDEALAVRQLEAREIDAAAVVASTFMTIHPGLLEEFAYSPAAAAAGEDTGDLLILPYSLYAVAPIHNLPSTVVDTFTGWPLVADLRLLGRIFSAGVTSWTDPAIEDLNPGLAAAFTSTGASTNITLVVCCGTGVAGPSTNSFVSTLNASSTDFANLTSWTLPVDWSVMVKAAAAANITVVEVVSESQLESAVNRIEGAIGYRLNTLNDEEETKKFAVRRTTLADTLLYSDSSDAVVTTLAASIDTLSPCVDAVTPSVELDFIVRNVVPTTETVTTLSQCWPFLFLTTLLVPVTYTDTLSDSCLRGNHTLLMIQWMTLDSDGNTFANKHAAVRFSQWDEMAALQTAALESATCDGSTMLVTLDTVWTLSTAITSLGWALMAIGILLVLASVGILVRYRHRAVLRSSSVPFQFVILFGLMLLFVSIGVFGMKPSTSQCQSLAWLINIGFTLTFGPLFAKMWRIYKIFDRRVLRVVKISNEKLGMIVAGLVLIDIIVNSAWQAVSPVYAGTQLHTDNGVIWSYEQCTGDSGAVPFLVALLGEKCLMLVFGSFMGFTTRNVSSTFNESKNVAWAIYNVFFSGAIIVLVLIFSGVRGDSYIILILMLITWISFSTMGLNFASKFIVLFRSDEANAAATSASHQSAEGVGSAQLFSFASLTDVPKASLDRYIATLEAQMQAAKVRHQELLDGGGGGGSHHAGTNLDSTRAAHSARRDGGQRRSDLGLVKRSRGGGGGDSSGGGGVALSKEGRSRDATVVSRASDAYRVTKDDDKSEPPTPELQTLTARSPYGGAPPGTQTERAFTFTRVNSLRLSPASRASVASTGGVGVTVDPPTDSHSPAHVGHPSTIPRHPSSRAEPRPPSMSLVVHVEDAAATAAPIDLPSNFELA